MLTYKLISIFALTLLFLIVSCDVPRDNPFDPASDYYEKDMTTRVSVRQQIPPYSGITGVSISEETLGLFGKTMENGILEWTHEDAESLVVFTSKENYFSNHSVFKPLNKSNEFDIFLNAMPQISDINFYSLYNYYNENYAISSLSINAKIDDPDGANDVGAVILRSLEFPFSDTLTLATGNSGVYENSFYIRDISEALTPEQIPELNFELIVKNINQDSLTSGPLSVRRVIKTDFILNQPAEGSSVQDSVIFNWDEVLLNFNFHYNIVLLRVDNLETIVLNNIPSDQNEYIIHSLLPGNYLWQLQVQDQLGNICQSVSLSFIYEN